MNANETWVYTVAIVAVCMVIFYCVDSIAAVFKVRRVMPYAPKIVPKRPRPNKPPRKSTRERGYGAEHERQRKRLLAANPLCQRCGQAWATDLHHRDGNPFNRSDENAEMLCEKCHHGDAHGGQ